MTLREVVEDHVRFVLRVYEGNVSQAARELGISRTSLQRMLRRWDRARAAD